MHTYVPLLWNAGFRWVWEKRGGLYGRCGIWSRMAGGDPEIWYTRGTLRFASVTDQIRPHMI